MNRVYLEAASRRPSAGMHLRGNQLRISKPFVRRNAAVRHRLLTCRVADRVAELVSPTLCFIARCRYLEKTGMIVSDRSGDGVADWFATLILHRLGAQFFGRCRTYKATVVGAIRRSKPHCSPRAIRAGRHLTHADSRWEKSFRLQTRKAVLERRPRRSISPLLWLPLSILRS